MTSCQNRTSSVTAAITYSQGIAEKDEGPLEFRVSRYLEPIY